MRTGSITVFGRGAVCINSGGEKIFPEEVEAALKAHPGVADAVVVGVPDERWGQRVAAVVQARAGRRRHARQPRRALPLAHRRLQGAARSSRRRSSSCATRAASPTTAGRARPRAPGRPEETREHAMFIDYTRRGAGPRRAELRAYFARAGDRRAARRGGRHRGRRPALHAGAPPDGRRRLARHRLAEGVRRAGPVGHRAVHLLRRGPARGLPHPLPHALHGRPDADEVRHRRAEGAVPPGHPARRAPLRHRLQRARGRHRPRRRCSTRAVRDGRRLRRRRAEGVHQPRRVRRLHLARGPHRPRGAQATRASPS